MLRRSPKGDRSTGKMYSQSGLCMQMSDQSSLIYVLRGNPSPDSSGPNAQKSRAVHTPTFFDRVLLYQKGHARTHIVYIIGIPPPFVHCQNGEESSKNFSRPAVKPLEIGRAGREKSGFFLKL